MRGLALAGLLALAQAAAAGEAPAAFQACQACHSLEAGRNGVGPSLHGIVGRRIAMQEGFIYSNAATRSTLVWTRENLAAFLYDPQARLPGTRMAFSGLDDEAEIERLIDYLADH